MISKKYMGIGAIVVGLLIAATQFMNLPNELNYLWALLVLIWGCVAIMGK